MEVRRIEEEGGTLKAVEFIRTGDDDFKSAIQTWIQDNTSMDWAEFFERLEAFSFASCRINMS